MISSDLIRWLVLIFEPLIATHSPALLDLFISFDASISSTMAFPPLGNSDLVVVSASIYFPSNQKCDALFHPIAYDHSYGDWGAFHDHLGDVPREDIFKLSDSTAASGWN